MILSEPAASPGMLICRLMSVEPHIESSRPAPVDAESLEARQPLVMSVAERSALSRPRSWLRNLPITYKLALIVLAQVAVSAALLGIALFCLDISNGVRAYVAGEGLYSKGQKDAVYYLTRYAHSQSPEDHQKYLEAVAVPLGDHLARVELQKPVFDYAIAAQGFIQGGNAPGDVPHLIDLFRWFHGVSYFRRAIVLWTRADRLIAELVACGEELHEAVRAQTLTDELREDVLARIEKINALVTPVEQQFSVELGEGARLVRNTLLIVVLLSALLLLGGGLLVSWRISRELRTSILSLHRAAAMFTQGNLDYRSEVRSNDEVGRLSRAFNDMTARRKLTEEALRTATELRDKVMESVTNAIYVLDLEGRFTLVNRRTCEMTGYAADELIGHSFVPMIPPEHRDAVVAAFSGVAEGGPAVVSYETPLLRKDGTRVLIAFTSAPLFTEGRVAGVVGSAEDITERRRYEASLHEAKELAQVTLSSIGDGVIRTDAQGIITFCNQAAAKLLETDTEYPVGQRFSDLVHLFDDDGGRPLADPIAQVLASGETMRLNMFSSVRTIQGRQQPISDSVAPVRDAHGAVIGAVFVFQDVRDARQMTEKLSYQARHDQLTGLPNRLAFEERLQQALLTAQTAGAVHYLMFMDLDHFKVVNDTCGHAAGDKLLREVSALLRSRLRPADYLARLGGDEFAVVLDNATPAAANRVAENLIAAIQDYHLVSEGRTFKIGLSVGIAEINTLTSSASMVMAQADTACYAAKTSGRGRYQVYQADDLEIQQAERSLDWAQRIESALHDNRFEVHLQRIVGREREPLGYEALIRMRGEQGQTIPPEAFISAAKRMGWLTRIDQWMVREALELAHRRSVAGLSGYLSINLSAKSVGDPVFVDWMLPVVDGYRLGKELLRFEITETEQLEANSTEFRLISELRERGFQVWLDDFGMGYNSFDLLKRVRVDGLKIDISFTRDLLKDPVDRVMVEAIVSIGRAMSLQLLAEGVEDEETYSELKALGVQLFQGHLFHRAEASSRVALAEPH